jgi:AraC-like DNA-binding protein
MLSQMAVEDFRLEEGREMPGPPSGWMCAQLREGLAYRLGAADGVDLPLGGVVLLMSEQRTVLRSSQLRPSVIRRFRIQLESMSGILTIEEDTALRCLAEEKAGSGWTLPADHPAALELAEMPVGFGRSPGQRIQLLGLALDIVGPLPNSEDESDAAASPTVTERFRRLMGGISEGELVKSSPETLARRCRCTVRHLNRLFRQTYGMALRAKLRELQLRDGGGEKPDRQILRVSSGEDLPETDQGATARR